LVGGGVNGSASTTPTTQSSSALLRRPSERSRLTLRLPR
jgi:hypothetical protein